MEELEGWNPVEYLETGKVTKMFPRSLKQSIGLVSAGRTIFSSTAFSQKVTPCDDGSPEKAAYVAAAPVNQTCFSSKA